MRINKKIIIIGIAIFVILAIAIFFLWKGGKTEKVYHVGILSGLDFVAGITDGFKSEMTNLGYVEGKNIQYEVKQTNFNLDEYKKVAQGFVNDKVDLIVVFPTEASIEAKAVAKGTGIPVVFANAFTEDTGLVDSIPNPGKDITGVRWLGPELALKRLSILMGIVPNAKHIWIPYQKGYPIVKSQIGALKTEFIKRNLTMIEMPADNATKLETMIKEQEKLALPDAILIIAEPLMVTPDSFVIAARFAEENKIPFGGAMFSNQGFETLFGATPQSIPQGKQVAFLANKILKGSPAGSLPVMSAEDYIIINYKQAKKFGLNISESVLAKANEVIR